jgi:hypothetical protein
MSLKFDLARTGKSSVCAKSRGSRDVALITSWRQRMSRYVQKISGSALLIEESPISLGLIQALRENNINVVTVKPTKTRRSSSHTSRRLLAHTRPDSRDY